MKVILFLLCLKCTITSVYLVSPHPLVIVLAFDGFRFDYSNPQSTPTLERMRDEGVRVGYLQNVFPTKTNVNFFTISTGTYPETHGVLGNTVFDESGQCLQDSYEMYHYNPELVPIWVSCTNSFTNFGENSSYTNFLSFSDPQRIIRRGSSQWCVLVGSQRILVSKYNTDLHRSVSELHNRSRYAMGKPHRHGYAMVN